MSLYALFQKKVQVSKFIVENTFIFSKEFHFKTLLLRILHSTPKRLKIVQKEMSFILKAYIGYRKSKYTLETYHPIIK